MTVLELLRQELPKRGGWPEGANYAWIDPDYEIRFDNVADDFFTKSKMDNDQIGKCIGDVTISVTREQYEATGWDGTGLPPVGVECEVSVDGGRSWCTYRATSEKNGARLIEIGNFTEEFQSNNWLFRPLRTEAERAIDEMVRLSGVSTGAAKILYNAGYRK